MSPSAWFQMSHPLARVASERCKQAGHGVAGRYRVAACGACWEGAIRDDERFVSECGLPRELPVDAIWVDETAVELACAGDTSVSLSRFELWAVVARLQERGLGENAIAKRVNRNTETVRRILAGLRAGAAA